MNFDPQALQRVAIRMHFDPELVEQVYAGLPVDGLCERGRELVLRVDRRAWQTDQFRRSRLLHGLLEAYPVSALVTGLGPLDAFFSSPDFHDCVQTRGLVALTFGSWLLPTAGPFSTLERAIVQVCHLRKHTQRGWCCAPGLVALDLPGGTVEAWQGFRKNLGPDPVAELTAQASRSLKMPDFEGTEHVLVERAPEGGASIGWASPELVGLLQSLEHPVSMARAQELARSHGADAGEEEDVLAGLRADGLLIQR